METCRLRSNCGYSVCRPVYVISFESVSMKICNSCALIFFLYSLFNSSQWTTMQFHARIDNKSKPEQSDEFIDLILM